MAISILLKETVVMPLENGVIQLIVITYLDLVSSDISFDSIDIIEASNHLSIVWFGASVVVLVEEYKKNITNLSPYIIIKE